MAKLEARGLPSSGVPALDRMLPEGYPEKSAILVEGPPGNEKDALWYRFLQSGISEGHFCVCITRLDSSEIVQDAKAFGIDLGKSAPFWVSPQKGDRQYSPDDLAAVSFGVKEILKEHEGRKMRIVFDGLSQLLTLHSADSVYKFLGQLLAETKRHDAVTLATVQEGMHEPQVISSLELLFDGVISIRRTDKGGLEVTIKKMRGVDLSAHWSATDLSREGELGSSEATRPRVAVLPFANMSPDPNDEYFADGMTEELISTISKVRDVEVISRTSAMQYKKNPKPVWEISRELRVNAVLEGSVRKSGNKIRVTVQMIDAPKDRHLWAETYDRELQDIFVVQSDIAQRVAESMEVSLLGGDRDKIRKAPTRNMLAYEYYLKGLNLFERGPPGTIKESLRYFEMAIEVDPSFPMAYAALGNAYVTFAGELIAPSEAYQKAEPLIAKALELDQDLSEAHFALGNLALQYHTDWPMAEREFRRALDLNPSNAFAHFWYGVYWQTMNNVDEASREMGKAHNLDPLSLWIQSFIAYHHVLKREYADALIQYRRILKSEPDSPTHRLRLAWCHCLLGETREAEKEVEIIKGQKLRVGNMLMLSLVLGLLGKKEEAQTYLEKVEVERLNQYVPRLYLAFVYVALGDSERALSLLEEEFRDNKAGIAIWHDDPSLDPLRGNARFESLLSKLNLPRGVPSESQ